MKRRPLPRLLRGADPGKITPSGDLPPLAVARTTAMYHPLDSTRCSMQSPEPSPPARRVDERWFQEWVAFGMLEMAAYLTNHAMFAAYLARRDGAPVKRARRTQS